MVKDAELHAEEDKKAHELADAAIRPTAWFIWSRSP